MAMTSLHQNQNRLDDAEYAFILMIFKNSNLAFTVSLIMRIWEWIL